jgi:hypothetical protein
MDETRALMREARMVVLVVEVERERIARLLPPPLTPRRLFGTTCGMSIQFIDIPKSTIGPYRECTVSVLCKENFVWPRAQSKDWRSLPGFPIWIGVTSEIARRYGCEIWAYPKHVADVEFKVTGDAFRGAAGAGAVSVRCSAVLTRSLEPTAVEFRSVSARSGELLLAPMPGQANFNSDWDPCATYTLDLEEFGVGKLQGTARTGVFATNFDFELSLPTSVPLAGLARETVRGA